jgi:hypothetical protein
MPLAGSVSLEYARALLRQSSPPPPVRPGSRIPKVSPKTNQVLPSCWNMEPRSAPAQMDLGGVVHSAWPGQLRHLGDVGDPGELVREFRVGRQFVGLLLVRAVGGDAPISVKPR